MMRTLGTLILLSAAAFAQTPTAAQNPAAPATVSVQPATNKAQVGKPSPNGAKASTTTAAPKAKATVSAKATSAAKPATSTQKSVSVKPAVSTAKAASVQASAKPVVSSAKVNPISTGTKGTSTLPAAKRVSANVATAKAASADAKAKLPAAKMAPVVGVLAKPGVVTVTKGTSQPNSVSVKSNASTKPAVAHVLTKQVRVQAGAKPVTRAKPATHTKVAVAKLPAPKGAPSVQDGKPVAENKQASTEIHTAGRRDPFLSPVVAFGATGSGCSAGKRCLTIDQIALKGVVKSESGMIAVVTNALDKAYFLRENDPVFNGYVVKITGDSIIFKETFHDRLGKALTRDVTKSITRPVA
jgi:hypothetical protein